MKTGNGSVSFFAHHGVLRHRTVPCLSNRARNGRRFQKACFPLFSYPFLLPVGPVVRCAFFCFIISSKNDEMSSAGRAESADHPAEPIVMREALIICRVPSAKARRSRPRFSPACSFTAEKGRKSSLVSSVCIPFKLSAAFPTNRTAGNLNCTAGRTLFMKFIHTDSKYATVIGRRCGSLTVL